MKISDGLKSFLVVLVFAFLVYLAGKLCFPEKIGEPVHLGPEIFKPFCYVASRSPTPPKIQLSTTITTTSMSTSISASHVAGTVSTTTTLPYPSPSPSPAA